MRLMSGIDTAMPDVKKKWNYHAAWNQNDVLWREDFQQLAGCGFDLLRWLKPKSAERTNADLVVEKDGEHTNNRQGDKERIVHG